MFLYCMRKTINVEDSLMRRAKSVAAEHGEFLKNFIERAIIRELERIGSRGSSAPPSRVELPLIGGKRGKKKYTFSGIDLEAILAGEDARSCRGRQDGCKSGN